MFIFRHKISKNYFHIKVTFNEQPTQYLCSSPNSAFDNIPDPGVDLTRTVFLTDLSSNDNEILQIGTGGEIRICAKPTDFPERGYRTVGTFIEVSKIINKAVFFFFQMIGLGRYLVINSV